MKQKTIVLEWYHIWGTYSSCALRVQYGREVLRDIPCHVAESDKIFRNALVWAKNEGYTHWRMKSPMNAPRNIRKLEV